MIFISYYTKNTPYEKVANTYLLPSLKKWNLSYDIEGIPDFGNWQKNTHYKAKFCRKMLLKHKQPVIFLDADATIEQYPKLFEELENYDISFHELDWYKFWRNEIGKDKREVLSGTLYLNYTENTLKFIDDWISENNKSTNWEQRNMQKILEGEWKNKLKIYPLPIEYIAIIKYNGEIPNYIKNPVIIHHQVSRQYKYGK